MSTCFKFSHFKGRFVQIVLESINAILESKIFKQNEKAKLSKIKEKFDNYFFPSHSHFKNNNYHLWAMILDEKNLWESLRGQRCSLSFEELFMRSNRIHYDGIQIRRKPKVQFYV